MFKMTKKLGESFENEKALHSNFESAGIRIRMQYLRCLYLPMKGIIAH